MMLAEDRVQARMSWCVDHAETQIHLERYLTRLDLPRDRLFVTTERASFESWLGRRLRSSIGGAYWFNAKSGHHYILINLPRIDLSRPGALEVVVAEELVHMRDRLDGDLRRHAKHGDDRIAVRVSELTGASLDDIRAALLPVKRRPARFLYACPGCGTEFARQRRGRWSCGRCAPHFDARFVLQLVSA